MKATVDTDVVNRILIEVATGKEPREPDTPEMAAMRAQLKVECDEIVAKGGAVDVPHEIPDVR